MYIILIQRDQREVNILIRAQCNEKHNIYAVEQPNIIIKFLFQLKLNVVARIIWANTAAAGLSDSRTNSQANVWQTDCIDVLKQIHLLNWKLFAQKMNV